MTFIFYIGQLSTQEHTEDCDRLGTDHCAGSLEWLEL